MMKKEKQARRTMVSWCAYVFVSAFLVSCAFGDREDVVPAVTGDSGQVMYVAGRYAQHACLWIVKGSLSTRIMLPERPGTTTSFARAVAVDRGRVIVSGAFYNGVGYFPAIWINGLRMPPDYTQMNNTNDTNGNGLAAVDGKFYVTAVLGNSAQLLVNGAPVPLPVPPGATSSFATSIAMAYPRMIVGGYYLAGSNHACLWVDGILVTLDDTAAISTVNAVGTDGPNIYAGGVHNGNGVLWVDGMMTTIASGGAVLGLYVFGGIPYMGGEAATGNAFQWAGGSGIAQRLSVAASAQARGIFVYSGGMGGGVILAAGFDMDGGFSNAVLWIDGVPLRLDKSGGVADTVAQSVTVGPEIW